jgi:AcrR family transcriptional regulator
LTNPNTSEQRDTKTRILDAAEILFAENGYKRTSIKALASRARVNLAAVNYHFGSKHALVEKVIERRLSLVNDLRMEMFQQIEKKAARSGTPPSVPALLHAFIEPVFTVTDSLQKGVSFLMIEGRAFAEPDHAIRDIFIRHFKPAFMRLSGLMQAALPQLPPTVLRWRLHFAIGAFAHVLRVCGSRPARSVPLPTF